MTKEYVPPEEEETVEVKRRSELPGFLLSQTAPRPAFMEQEARTAAADSSRSAHREASAADSADIGSLTHRFLRLVDLTKFRDIAGSRRESGFAQQPAPPGPEPRSRC